MTTHLSPAPAAQQKSPIINLPLFTLILFLLVGGAILRSAIATSLDGFTIDEAYHITAGVSYVRYADFRINPEQPPLVKLWVGSLISATGFRLSAIRPFTDKGDEREFAEEDVFFHNDFNSVQRRARIAMWTLNGLLLLQLAFALRKTFGPVLALGTLLVLAIDPTVAAHLPVVMMDLPLSLLSVTAVVFAASAFRLWAWSDILACAATLGLALASKHSAPIFLVFVVLAGAIIAAASPLSLSKNSRALRFAKLAALVFGALIVLWSSYLFRFAESSAGHEVFNRPLAGKIADVHSPLYRAVLTGMASTHVVPRAYIWGFADTIRAGFEGRAIPITAFGRAYLDTAPRYFFPAMLALKLPIGSAILVLLGLFFFFFRRLPPHRRAELAVVLAALLLFLLVLAVGSTYAGIRHALPALVFLTIFAGAAIEMALISRSAVLRIAVVVAFVAAAASALPVMRPWEYFNELIGGAKNGYLYFSDEGVDLGQRGRELEDYYHRVVEPAGELPILEYGPTGLPEMKARRLDWLGQDPERDQARLSSATFTGTVLIDAKFVGPKPFWDSASLRATAPTTRFGNLLVYRGTCSCAALIAQGLYESAIDKIYAEWPDLEAGARLLRQSTDMDPSAYFASIELGNVSMKRGSREDALRAYSEALQHAPNDPELRRSLEQQIKRVSSEPLNQISGLRNPFLE